MAYYDKYSIEDHPFDTFVPEGANTMIIGTFPTFRDNFRYNFYYSGKDNSFWDILASVYNVKFIHQTGEKAVIERKEFLTNRLIAITDMHAKCYRLNQSSSDETLYPIVLTDIFEILRNYISIKKLVFTSRTKVFGALGLFKTYCMQQRHEIDTLAKRADKIIEGQLHYNNKIYEVLVPYSPSPRVITDTKMLNEVTAMYRKCLL